MSSSAILRSLRRSLLPLSSRPPPIPAGGGGEPLARPEPVSSSYPLVMPLRLLLTVVALLAAPSLPGAAPPPAPPPASPGGGEDWIQGCARRISGEILAYHAPLPEVDRALLVRSLDAERSIAWETAPVPADLVGEDATFVWLFGLDVTPERRRFELLVDGEVRAEFRNPATSARGEWSVPLTGGGELRFRVTKVDRYEDVMGTALLRLPREMVRPGEAVRLEVRGESADSRAWYMTFLAAVEERARLTSVPAIRRTPEGPRQPLRLDVVHLGPPATARLETSFGAPTERTLEFGANAIELVHPPATEARDIEVKVIIDGREHHHLRARIDAPRPWTVHLVQHVHTDIGYTRPQSEILPEHLRFIDTALDLCDRTDDWPEDARFRWTCETSWAVREWLADRSLAQVARLRHRVAEERIEVTGMLLNMSEVIDEASYPAYLTPVRTMREAGLTVTTGMQNDVNGVAWGLADDFPEIGIRYLIMGQHAHRALLPFDRPTTFWWESPAGSRVLAFRADHYMTGNLWGLHTGKLASVEERLLAHLAALEARGYPHERIAVQYSGYLTDNSPPSLVGCELIRRWNEKYVTPRLRSSVAREFPRWVEEEHGDELPVHRAAWPDWWTDGFGSAARETATARVAQGELVALESLAAVQQLAGVEPPPGFRDETGGIRDALLFYGEHTFGAAESIRDPLGENSVVQWRQKSSYAWEAARRTALLREKIVGRLPVLVGASDEPRLVVANPSPFPRSGTIEVYADHEILPLDRRFRIVDAEGNSLPVRRGASRSDGTTWTIGVRDVPPLGYRAWRVVVEADAPPADPDRVPGTTMENGYWRLVLDETTGAISSLYDKAGARELIDPDSPWHGGQLVRETLGNREQLEAFTLEDFARETVTDVVIDGILDTALGTSVVVHGELPGCASPAGVRWEIRLFDDSPRIELEFTARKRRVTDPEALYVAFPFQLPEARVRYETLGGTATPGEDLLPGTASDWQAMQSFVTVQSPAGQIVLTSNEIPLVQLGAINTGAFRRVAEVKRPHVFSWVMNNYWTTNFRASQEGDFTWSYALTAGSDASTSFAAGFGTEERVPLLGRILPAGLAGESRESRSLLALDTPGVVLVAARPAADGRGIILHLREVDGETAWVPIEGWRFGEEAARVGVTSVLEEGFREVTEKVRLAPFERVHLRVVPSSR